MIDYHPWFCRKKSEIILVKSVWLTAAASLLAANIKGGILRVFMSASLKCDLSKTGFLKRETWQPFLKQKIFMFKYNSQRRKNQKKIYYVVIFIIKTNKIISSRSMQGRINNPNLQGKTIQDLINRNIFQGYCTGGLAQQG